MGTALAGRAAARSCRLLSAVVVIGLLLSACGGSEEPELTFEDRLVALEGRPLTPAEVAERVEIGETLCLFEDDILDALWQQLSDDQLDFQDIVISDLCPERAILYAGHTGRFVTEEAEESGVRTSTTRPTSTAATTVRPATTRPSTPTTANTGTTTDPSDSASTSTATSAATATSATASNSTTGSSRPATASTATTAPGG